MRIALAAPLLLIISACSPELSRTEGVSIKRCHHQSVASYQDKQGRYIEEDSLASILSIPQQRVISTVDLSNRYDIASTPLPVGKADEARQITLRAVQDTFGFSVVSEKRQMPVLILAPAEAQPPKLVTAPPDESQHLEQTPPRFLCGHFPLYNLKLALQPYQPTRHTFRAYPIKTLAIMLEEEMRIPVLDETNLRDRYDFELVVDRKKGMTLADSLAQVGLQAKPARRDLEALYVNIDPDVTPVVALPRLDKPTLYWTPH